MYAAPAEPVIDRRTALIHSIESTSLDLLSDLFLTKDANNNAIMSSHGFHKGRPMEFRLRAMAQIYELLVRNRRASKRDLFYEHKLLYGNQSNFDRALSSLCKLLHASRTELHVVNCSRGFVIGDLKLSNADANTGEYVDFQSSPVAIVESLIHFGVVRSTAQFLLVVEKDAIFQRLIEERFLAAHPHAILVTGRGYPDICTRQFLHWLAARLPTLPMLALVDADPYGLEIYATYKYGGTRRMIECGAIELARLQLVGLLPSEAHMLAIPQHQFLALSARDRRKIEKLAERMLLKQEQAIYDELSFLMNAGWKLELEALGAISEGYLTAIYLDHKLQQFETPQQAQQMGIENGGGGQQEKRREMGEEDDDFFEESDHRMPEEGDDFEEMERDDEWD